MITWNFEKLLSNFIVCICLWILTLVNFRILFHMSPLIQHCFVVYACFLIFLKNPYRLLCERTVQFWNEHFPLTLGLRCYMVMLHVKWTILLGDLAFIRFSLFRKHFNYFYNILILLLISIINTLRN